MDDDDDDVDNDNDDDDDVEEDDDGDDGWWGGGVSPVRSIQKDFVSISSLFAISSSATHYYL
jgi:hypothetical protein